MKEYPNLASEKKSKNISLAFIVASLLLGLLAVFVPSASKLLKTLGCLASVALFGYAMHYLDYHNVQGQSIKKYVLAFHTYAIHAILFAATLFTGEAGTLSHQVIHGLSDALLVAALLCTAKIFKNNISNTIVAVVSIIGFVLSLLNANVLLNILLIACAVLLILYAYKESMPSVCLAVVVILLALTAIFTKQNAKFHDYMQILAVVAMMAIAYLFYNVVSPNVDTINTYRSNLDLNPTDSSRSTTSRVATGAATGAAVNSATRSNSSKDSRKDSKSTSTRTRSTSKYTFDRSWFIKEYENESYENLLNAPVYAFKGVSEDMAKDLKDAFGIKTIGELADSKYFAWAKEIVEEAK